MSSGAFPREVSFIGPLRLWPDDEAAWDLAQSVAVPGVYLFTALVEGEYRIFYVGEAADISNRIREHLTFYLAGKYLIYDASQFALGKLEVKWRPSPLTERTLARIAEHRIKLEAMLRLVYVFFAEIHAGKEALRRIESGIVRLLRADGTASAFLENQRLSVAMPAMPKSVSLSCVTRVYCLRGDMRA